LFAPSRRICESRSSKKFFSENFCTVGQAAAARQQAEWQLPARRQDEGND
jgi:hypothetical protein